MRTRSLAIVFGLLGALALLGPAETRAELLHEGPGIWLNGPMFLALLPAYAALTVTLVPVVATRLPGKRWGRALEGLPRVRPVTTS